MELIHISAANSMIFPRPQNLLSAIFCHGKRTEVQHFIQAQNETHGQGPKNAVHNARRIHQQQGSFQEHLKDLKSGECENSGAIAKNVVSTNQGLKLEKG